MLIPAWIASDNVPLVGACVLPVSEAVVGVVAIIRNTIIDINCRLMCMVYLHSQNSSSVPSGHCWMPSQYCSVGTQNVLFVSVRQGAVSGVQEKARKEKHCNKTEWNHQGFIYWGMQGGIFPPKPLIFPPKAILHERKVFFLSFQCVHIIFSCH